MLEPTEEGELCGEGWLAEAGFSPKVHASRGDPKIRELENKYHNLTLLSFFPKISCSPWQNCKRTQKEGNTIHKGCPHPQVF